MRNMRRRKKKSQRVRMLYIILRKQTVSMIGELSGGEGQGQGERKVKVVEVCELVRSKQKYLPFCAI